VPAASANHSILIVGFGSAGERAREVIGQQRPETEFAILSRRQVTSRGFKTYKSLSDLQGFRPDAVVLSGPATKRVEILRELVPVEVPVFAEKPMASNLREALLFQDLLGPSEPFTQIGYNLRFSKSLNFFRELVHSRRFGRAIRFTAETGQYLPDWRPEQDYRETVSARAELGGGVLLELSHEFDYLRWIFGEWDWVSAWIGKCSKLEIDVEDTALMSIGITSTHGEPSLVGQVTLDFVRRDKTRTILAVCEDASVRWDGSKGTVDVRDTSRSGWVSLFKDAGSGSTYDEQWRSFLSVIEDQSVPVVGVQDGIQVMRIIEAIRISYSEGGARVSISEQVATS